MRASLNSALAFYPALGSRRRRPPGPATRILSALASRLRPSARNATPAGSTQPSPRGVAAQLEERAAPQLDPIHHSPRRARRLRLLGRASARTNSALASSRSSPAAPRPRLSSNCEALPELPRGQACPFRQASELGPDDVR